MKNINIEWFSSLLKMSQQQLKRHLVSELRRLGYTSIFNNAGYLYAEGEWPVLLVAHLDTVFENNPEIICSSDDGRWLMSPQGIGGDDRCGVYMILQMIQSVKCHVLFCEDEEVGGKGARKFVKSGIYPEVNYIIELDRRGENDAVFYGCNNPDFIRFICNFKFQQAQGSFSDISIVAPYLKRAAVNISAGYRNEHRLHEVVDLYTVDRNVKRVLQIVSTPTKMFPYIISATDSLLLAHFKQEKKMYLNPLPDDVCLVVNGCVIEGRADNYLVDEEGKVYIHLPGLRAAVELEYAYACDCSGQAIPFRLSSALYLEIISVEEAVERMDQIEQSKTCSA